MLTGKLEDTLNWMKMKTAYQNLWDANIMVLRKNFVVLNFSNRTENRFQSNYLSLPFREKRTHKPSVTKDIISEKVNIKEKYWTKTLFLKITEK